MDVLLVGLKLAAVAHVAGDVGHVGDGVAVPLGVGVLQAGQGWRFGDGGDALTTAAGDLLGGFLRVRALHDAVADEAGQHLDAGQRALELVGGGLA